jgi:hypothetical protein
MDNRNEANRELLDADAELRKEKNDKMADSQQQGEAIGGHDRGSDQQGEAKEKAEDRPAANA